MIYENIVVGSGISALGCILGLLENKKQILCIDSSKNYLDSFNKENNKNVIFCKQGLPLRKLSEKFVKSKFFNPLEILENSSFGGLSNIWGANSLRPLKNDFDEWPIGYSDLEKYYEICEEIMNISHFDDKISSELKIQKNKNGKNKIDLFSNFIRHFIAQKRQTNDDFLYGFGRVALNPKCDASSNYFFGCKDDFIFNAKDHIKKLIEEKKILYRDNLILKKIVNEKEYIRLVFDNNNVENIFAKKLFIGTGSIQTPRIVMNSLSEKKEITLKESQAFFIPCMYTGKKFNNNPEHHTLTQAQVIFKNDDKQKLKNTYYEIKYDEILINSILKIKFSFLSNLIPKFIKQRLFVITGFINSKDSIWSAKIKKDNSQIEIVENKINKKNVKTEILDQIKILEKNFNFLSIKFMMKLGNFGRGFHLGASIPMLKQNSQISDLYTNKNGEISKFKNVFIIDGSNFTNIPASGFSLTIMANALRIAMENLDD